MRKQLIILLGALALEVLVTFLNRRWPLPWLIYLETLLMPLLALALLRVQRLGLFPSWRAC